MPFVLNAWLDSQGDKNLNGPGSVEMKPKVEPVVENSVHLSSLLSSNTSGMKNMNATTAQPSSLAQAVPSTSTTTPVTPSSIGVKMEVDPSAIKEEVKMEVKTEAPDEDTMSSSQFKEEPAASEGASSSPKTEPMDENSQNSSLDMKPSSVEPGTSQSNKPCHKKRESPSTCISSFVICFSASLDTDQCLCVWTGAGVQPTGRGKIVLF